MKSRGLSLLEAIVAIFLLAGGSLACFTLLLQSFRYQARTQAISDATLCAEQTLEHIRQWALVAANFDSDWAVYSDQDFPLEGLVAHTIVSELRRPGDVITDCYRVVSVQVKNESRTVVRLSGQIGSPLRSTVTAVNVTNESGEAPLSVNGKARFHAYLLDGETIIPGVSFNWEVSSLGGFGTIDPLQPNQALLTNLVYGPTPPDPHITHVPGTLVMRATCRYRGQLVQGDSLEVKLLGP